MRERILEAVGAMIMRDGLASIGVNALAREAGCDKVLIYRYFGDLDGVYAGFAAKSDFWWTVEEFTDGIDPSRMPLAEALKIDASPPCRRLCVRVRSLWPFLRPS